MTPRTLLFTDLVDSTALVERVGDACAAELWGEHDRRARALLARHPGREIDRTDGFFLLFDAVGDAARYAVAYHQAMADLSLSARVGLHVGPVTLRDNDPADVARGAKPLEVEGLAKPFAARIMSLARGGQTLLSASARTALGEMLPDSTEVDSHGHYRLKGVEEPVEIFELGLPGCAFVPPADADKAYRVVRGGELWRPLREVRHNLVPERDAFIGRSAELRTLAHKLDGGSRLLTMLGPGGTGKTRLVRRFGLAWLGDWPGGVYFCDLSEARSLDGIYFAVAFALGVPLGKDDPAVQLGHAIAGRGRCLVILDNFEQVIVHAPATLGRWLDRAGEAAFVVTSRERLHLPGEHVLAVEPLPLGTEAIELFAARAKAQRAGFEITPNNRAAVAEVVRLLDGLPLAIELAAARVRVMSPGQIVDRLKDRFRLLAGAKGAAARQATLKAAIDWSWDLLTPWEQAALAQCSVFEGGFTLEAAEAVLDLSPWPEAPPAMDAVQALVDKSLLRAWVPKELGRLDIAEPYFGMYMSIHEYAAEKLDQDATRQAQRRHGHFFARFGSDEAIDELAMHGGVKQRHTLALELDNLVAACRRAVTRADAAIATATYRVTWEVLALRGPVSLGVDLGALVLGLSDIPASQLIDVAVSRASALLRAGRLAESRLQLGQALALAESAPEAAMPPPPRGGMSKVAEPHLLISSAARRQSGTIRAQLGNIDREQGHMQDAKRHMEAALAIHREVGNRIGQGHVLHNLGNLLDQLGIPVESRAHHESALALYTDIGNLHGIGQVKASLGILNRHQGRMQESLEHYEAALAVHREMGDTRSEGMALGNMANTLSDLGRDAESREHLESALAIHRQVGNRIMESYVLANLGLAYLRQGRRTEAREQQAQALAIDREVGNSIHEGVVLTNLGALEIAEQQFDRARTALDAALKRHREVGNRVFIGVTLAALGELLTAQSRPLEALELLSEGEAVLRAIDNPFELASLLCVKGQAAAAGGELGLATSALQEAQAIAARLAATPNSGLMQSVDGLDRAIAEQASAAED